MKKQRLISLYAAMLSTAGMVLVSSCGETASDLDAASQNLPGTTSADPAAVGSGAPVAETPVAPAPETQPPAVTPPAPVAPVEPPATPAEPPATPAEPPAPVDPPAPPAMTPPVTPPQAPEPEPEMQPEPEPEMQPEPEPEPEPEMQPEPEPEPEMEQPPPSGSPSCKAMGWATRESRSGGAYNITGGGDATPIIVKNFGDLQAAAEGSDPKVIYIDGTVGGGWSGRSGDRLEVGSNKTIAGLKPGTELKAPIHVKNQQNVIIRNIVIQGPGSSSDQAWDNINIEGSSKNVWVDHCEFWNGQDGNADVVKGADTVTFTWNIFGYTNDGGHNFSNLVASSDNEPQSEGKLNITLMFNHFRGVAQRQPRCRYGDIHVVNNLFTKDGMTSQNGISAGKQCRVLVENNHFIGIKHPVHKRSGGKSELKGENIFESTDGDTTGNGGPAFNPPYEYSAVPASAVKGMLEGKVGATLSSPDACD